MNLHEPFDGRAIVREVFAPGTGDELRLLGSHGLPPPSPAASEAFYAFASFRLYPKQRTLLREAELVSIGGRAFDLLLLLVSRPGTVVSPSDLMNAVWPNVTVEEANLRVQMGTLRKILSTCDEAQRAIETIPLRGSCFILPVRHIPQAIEPERPTSLARAAFPILLNRIIGRDDAIATVQAALDERQLVTITGPGGIGKTTVAIATARRYATHFRGLTAFVDLSQATDGDGVARAIGEALGLEPRHDALIAICEHLHARDALLIVDTCEHLVEPTAKLAESLLSCCANLRMLATSREALRATGEWTHRLPSLTFPAGDEEISDRNLAEFSAITLFVDHIRSSMRFDVEAGDLSVLAEICRRLDGNPLALELAAARVADLGLRQIADHLDDRFSILTRGRRTALPRHRTLSAALEWSYSLLSEDEQRMLRHLAEIGSSFTAELALADGGEIGREWAPEALSGLYEKSLLSVDARNGAPIYRLLDTTRAYIAGLSARDRLRRPAE